MRGQLFEGFFPSVGCIWYFVFDFHHTEAIASPTTLITRGFCAAVRMCRSLSYPMYFNQGRAHPFVFTCNVHPACFMTGSLCSVKMYLMC